jgi:hypothetical protein
MVKVCVKVPIPTFNILFDAILPALPSLPKFQLPGLLAPCLPSPLFGDISFPQFEAIQVLKSFQQFQLLSILKALAQPVIDFLGLDLDSFFPKIPGTDIGIIGFLTGTGASIYAAIKRALDKDVKFPFIPSPLFGSIKSPSLELANAVMLIVAGWVMTLIGKLLDLVGMLLDMLNSMEIPGLPSLPTLPEFPSLSDLIPDINAPSVSFPTIPGFPSFPSLPSPLIPGIKNPEMDFLDILVITLTNIATFPLTIIMDLLMSIADKFGASFVFPLPCITLA